jgi:hypothetical protein
MKYEFGRMRALAVGVLVMGLAGLATAADPGRGVGAPGRGAPGPGAPGPALQVPAFGPGAPPRRSRSWRPRSGRPWREPPVSAWRTR